MIQRQTLTILLPGAGAADVDGRLKALLDCLLVVAAGLDGEFDDTDEMEASDKRLTAADNTGIVLLLSWSDDAEKTKDCQQK